MSLPPLVAPGRDLTVDEVRRYSRHLIIPDVGMTGQKRLKNAKVLCVGAGGLGSPALLYLAAAGVGTLGVIDFDVVDESNLQRQIIHGQSDIGRPKAVSARESINEINPLVNVVLHEERLDSDNAMEIFARLRPDRRRHRQLRHPVPGQRRLRAAGQALRLGLDLPVRRPGQRLLGRVRPVLPLPVPGAAAAGHGAVLRRGRRARRAVRVDRVHPGQRGDQAHHRDRRAACRPADDLRRAGDDLPVGQGPEGPRVPDLRQEPDDHRADRLRRVLRRGLRGRAAGGGRVDDHRHRAQGHAGPRTTTSSWSTSGSRTSTRSSPSPARR